MKYFSVHEAEALIPQLERIFESASQIKSQAEAKAASIQALENSPDRAQTAIEHAQLEFLARSLEEALEGVEKLGATLKGLDPALVDFPHVLGDEEVYLCWKAGEKAIRYYHGLEEGFAGRQPLPAARTHH